MALIGATSLGWSGTPLPKVFEQLAALGGACIELNSRGERHHDIVYNRATIPQVKQWAADHGIAITSVGGYSNFAQTDTELLNEQIELLLDACRLAADLGVPITRAFVGEPIAGRGLTFADLRPTIIEAFQAVAHQAGVLGVTVAIENHGHLINEGPGMVRLLQDIGASNVKLTLDTGNFAWAGRTPEQVEADFAAALPHAVSVHVKDGRWIEEGFVFVPAGQGELKLAALIGQLIETGYDGPIISEYEGSGDYLDSTRASIDFLRRAAEAAS